MSSENGEPSRRDLLRLAGLGVAAAVVGPGPANATPPQIAKGWSTETRAEWQRLPREMTARGDIDPPAAYHDFSIAFPEECQQGSRDPRGLMERAEGTDAEMNQLMEINLLVNTMITPMTDREQHGVADRWNVAMQRGDCEDVALLKRHKLIGRGWRPETLLMTVVKQPNGDGHAVLTARTKKGDFILDFNHENVLLWSQVHVEKGYYFISRQSYLNPNVWKDLMKNNRPGSEPPER